MLTISEESREQFIHSLQQSYKTPGSFRDPHPEDRPDHIGITIYIKNFVNKMAISISSEAVSTSRLT